MSKFKTWFDKEYPLPEGYERGPIGRDLMVGCEKAYEAGKAELQAENKRLKKALGDCRDTLILCELIDKSGQAKASADMAEQVLKG